MSRLVAKRLASFAILPLVSAAASLAFLPVVARSATPEEWVAVMLGQSIGAFGSLVTLLGWNVNGPMRVASLPEPNRRAIYQESVRSRLAALSLAAPATIAVAAAVSPGATRLLAGSVAFAACLAGLSPGWFATGEGRPGALARFETVPRVAAVLLSSIGVAVTGIILLYPLLLAIGTLIGVAAFDRRLRRQPFSATEGSAFLSTLRTQASAASTAVFAGTYTAIALALVAATSSVVESAEFAAGFRLYQFALLAVVAVNQALMADTRRGRQSETHLRRAARLHLAVGVIGLLVIWLAGPQLTEVLFTDSYAIDPFEAFLFGVSFFMVSWGTYVAQQLLIPHDLTRYALRSVMVGAAFGVPLTALLARTSGAHGGTLAFAMTEFLVTAWSWSAWVNNKASVQRAQSQPSRLGKTAEQP